MKKKRSYLITVLSAVLAALALCASSCSIEFEKKQEAETVTETEADTEAQSAPVTPSDTLEGCLFIGDSRTEGLRVTNSLPGADVFSIVGLTVFDVTEREMVTGDGSSRSLDHFLTDGTYEKVYILLGINEISADLDTVAGAYSELISLVRKSQPGAKIIVQANPHVASWRSSLGDSYNNGNVDLLNGKLFALTDGEDVCWLDANPILIDTEGGLRAEYSEEDGIHPNRSCYTVWGEWIVSQNANF